jgi:lysophospholipase L1-like esterase
MGDNVYFLDTSELLEGEDWDNCLADGTHPTDLGYLLMANGFKKILDEILK